MLCRGFSRPVGGSAILSVHADSPQNGKLEQGKGDTITKDALLYKSTAC